MDLIPSMLLDRQFRLATPRSRHLQLALEGKLRMIVMVVVVVVIGVVVIWEGL